VQVGWYSDGRDMALRGLEHLLTKAKSPDGSPGFVHLLASDGEVIDPIPASTSARWPKSSGC
jgi:hypothetical protein